MAEAMEIPVRVQPRAGRNEIVGMRNGAVVVRVAAAPVDGKSNDALCKLIAKRLQVPRQAVAVVRGAHGRDKLLRIEGVDAETAARALGLDS